MNLRPTETPKVKGDQSRYSLVIAIAKRARQIAEEAEKKGEIIIEKPVDLAVQDMMRNCYVIRPAEEKLQNDALESEAEEQLVLTDESSEKE